MQFREKTQPVYETLLKNFQKIQIEGGSWENISELWGKLGKIGKPLESALHRDMQCAEAVDVTFVEVRAPTTSAPRCSALPRRPRPHRSRWSSVPSDQATSAPC
jgi:hypothetical protein